MTKTENAFAIIHFGENIKYFELELYFCIMLKKYTKQNIIYMYSETDTPSSFVKYITPFVYKTIGFNDNGITFNINFPSKYTSFNTLRTCDFIFAYNLLTDYKKVCIIESDLVIMNDIDSIFDLNTPSILCYKCGDKNLNKNISYTTNKKEIISNCNESGLNGGIMLIEPNVKLYDEYVKAVPIIAEHGCKYPNEALFEYSNNVFYNLPVKYNLSHYHTLRLSKYGLNPDGRDILIYHFNETDFKHLDNIKEEWLKKNMDDSKVKSKYRVRKIPILHFENTVYEPNKKKVNKILESLNKLTKKIIGGKTITKKTRKTKERKIPKRYIPKSLSKREKQKQHKEINKSRKLYQKGIYHSRPKMKSFHSKTSKHILKAQKIYGIQSVLPNKELARKTGCSLNALNQIIKKGQGAYFSSGSRPNQSAQSWAIARLASSITAGKAAKVDFHILEKGCKKNSRALRLARTLKKTV